MMLGVCLALFATAIGVGVWILRGPRTPEDFDEYEEFLEQELHRVRMEREGRRWG